MSEKQNSVGGLVPEKRLNGFLLIFQEKTLVLTSKLLSYGELKAVLRKDVSELLVEKVLFPDN